MRTIRQLVNDAGAELTRRLIGDWTGLAIGASLNGSRAGPRAVSEGGPPPYRNYSTTDSI